MKTVVHDFIRQKNMLGEKITPIYLYSIRYNSDTNSWQHWTSYMRDTTFDSTEYERQVIKHNDIRENASGMIESVKLTIGNGDRRIQYLLNNYNGLKKAKCLIKLVWLENLDNTDCYLEYEFEISNGSADASFAELHIGSILENENAVVPGRTYSRYRCQVAEFKDADCGYSGAESSCDRLFGTCLAYGNISRVGMFPGAPMSFPIKGI